MTAFHYRLAGGASVAALVALLLTVSSISRGKLSLNTPLDVMLGGSEANPIPPEQPAAPPTRSQSTVTPPLISGGGDATARSTAADPVELKRGDAPSTSKPANSPPVQSITSASHLIPNATDSGPIGLVASPPQLEQVSPATVEAAPKPIANDLQTAIAPRTLATPSPTSGQAERIAPALNPVPVLSQTPEMTARLETPAPAGPFAMSSGERVIEGRQAPRLEVVFELGQIGSLIANGRVVAFALSTKGKDLAFFDTSRRFRPIRELDPATISDRLISINDAELEGAWNYYAAGTKITDKPVFALRFTAAFEQTVVAQQLQALEDRHIDFDESLKTHKTVITRGRINQNLDFEISSISVK